MEKVKKHWKPILTLVGLLAVVLLSFSSYFAFIGIKAIINAIAVVGIVIISGYASQLHLGQCAFIGIGAYVSAILMTKCGVNFWLTIPCSVVVSGLMGWLLSIPTLRLKGGSYLALVTQCFGEIVYLLLLNLEALTNGAFGILGIPAPAIASFQFTDLRSYMLLCLVFLIVVYLVVKRILGSKYGRFFLSIKESEEAAQSVGINTRKYKMIAFVLATSVAGLAGVLYGPYIGYLSPEQFRWSASLTLVGMAIVGGLGSVEGGILGAVLLTFLPELLRSTDQLRMVLYGTVIILSLAFIPNGLISLFGKSGTEIGGMLRGRVKELSGLSERKKMRDKTIDRKRRFDWKKRHIEAVKSFWKSVRKPSRERKS